MLNKKNEIIIEKWEDNILVEIIISYEDVEKVFRDFYEKNKKLRYCNDSFYRLKDPEFQKKYFEWINKLSKQTRYNMYYGNKIINEE